MSKLFNCVEVLLFACVGVLSVSIPACALETGGVYVEGGPAAHAGARTDSLSVGVTFPFAALEPLHGGAVSFYGDLFFSSWNTSMPGGEGRRTYHQIGVLANWRYRFNEGRSPWFVEGGVGATVMDHVYRAPDRQFSTAFQFTEQLGVGRSFGARGQHEAALRVQHFSNAGIKKPNPGVNFVRLRYLYRF